MADLLEYEDFSIEVDGNTYQCRESRETRLRLENGKNDIYVFITN